MVEVFCYGRVTKDVELSTTNNGKNYCRFDIASDRKYKDAKGEKITDFHKIVVWGAATDFVHKYAKKGRELIVVGELQNRSYEGQDGIKRNITEIIASEVKLVGSGPQQSVQEPTEPVSQEPKDKEEMQPVDDETLPF